MVHTLLSADASWRGGGRVRVGRGRLRRRRMAYSVSIGCPLWWQCLLIVFSVGWVLPLLGSGDGHQGRGALFWGLDAADGSAVDRRRGGVRNVVLRGWPCPLLLLLVLGGRCALWPVGSQPQLLRDLWLLMWGVMLLLFWMIGCVLLWH